VELGEWMEGLVKQVYQPCVVAVVGRVKVGKSTFVNALLGEDLPKVGSTETTATTNYFTY
jgi:GTPase Era involved in 16S rRNA processing